MKRIGIIGGGASGIVAAIAAARSDGDAQVFILEQKESIGKKILATGNGRCNLTNEAMDASCYHGEDPEFARNVLEQFGYGETLEFFASLGLFTKSRGGYIYPRSDQAASVLELLEMELRRQKVKVYTGVRVEALKRCTGIDRGTGCHQRCTGTEPWHRPAEYPGRCSSQPAAGP